MGLAAAIVLGGSGMAHADPTVAPPASAPDAGAHPQSGSDVTVPPPAGSTPTGTGTGDTSAAGPMAAEIESKSSEVELLAEEAKEAKDRVHRDGPAIDTARRNLTLANRLLALYERRAGRDSSQQYKSSARIPEEMARLNRQLHALSKLAPWLVPGAADGYQDAASYADAKRLADDARRAYRSALDQRDADQADYESLRDKYQAGLKALDKLKADNKAAVQELADEQQRNANRILSEIGTNVDGMQANPRAVRAVKFALKQVGKPYKWAAEGPDAYDCSGLIYASYRSVGVNLPRVSSDQYRATANRPVSLSDLLPGDLLFYGTPGDTGSIYHVAMYVGDGTVVQAPEAGVPVQVVTVSIGGLYGATRVLPAVKKSHPHPTPTPSPSTSPKPSHSPSKSPSPSPSSQPSTSPSGPSPSPTPSSSKSKSPSPSPGKSKSPSPSCSPSSSASASKSGSASPSASTSSSASSSPSAAASPSESSC